MASTVHQTIVKGAKTIAVAGASNDPEKEGLLTWKLDA
jgi:predicted CoA-binding protein